MFFEREDLFVFGLEREFEFDDVRPFEPLLLDRELDFLLVAILSSSGC